MDTERRKFIKSSCNLCLLAAGGFLFSELAACSPVSKVVKVPVLGNQVKIPLSSIATEHLLIVRPTGWYFDIAVRKNNDQTYEALLLQCTHQQNQLVVNPNGYKCNLHGSQFDVNGLVLKGPAEIPLKKFNTTVDQDQLIIHLKA